MLTIQITCACGHCNTITDKAAIARFQRAERMTFRCTNCGMTERVEARLAWTTSINPMESAYATGMKDLEE